MLYLAANIIPSWLTLIPSAFVVGVFAGGLWSAKCTYLTELAYILAEITGEVSETVVNRFFGIFFAMFQTSQILGNLISSVVLKPPVKLSNQTGFEFDFALCGYNDCPGNAAGGSSSIPRPQDSTVYTLCFIYLILACISIALIAFFLDSFDDSKLHFTGSF